MVEKILESVLEDIKKAKQNLQDVKVLIETAKEAGIDVSTQEIEASSLEDRIKAFENAIMKRLQKK